MCLERDCLWEASYLMDNMNGSSEPCEDFYAFACGDLQRPTRASLTTSTSPSFRCGFGQSQPGPNHR